MSTLIFGFLMTLGLGQTPLNGGNVPYTVDFANEITILAEGNCNGETYTFAEMGGSFIINNAEGVTCDPGCASGGGSNDNEFETVEFNIACLADVVVDINWNYTGDLEHLTGCPTGGLQCGNDGVAFYYNLDGAGPTLIEDVETCDTDSGVSSVGPFDGTTLIVSVVGGTQAQAEIIEIEGITIDGIPSSTGNEECADAIEIFDGSNTGLDNFCDSDDGIVWYFYTASDDGAVQIDLTVNANDPQIYSVLSSCGATNPMGLPATNFTSSCLNSGDGLWLGVGDDADFGNDEFDLEITLLPPPDAADIDFTITETDGSDDFTVCPGDDFDLEVEDANDDGSFVYDWTLGDGSTVINDMSLLNITDADPAIHDGTWVVTVTDAAGCTGTDEIVVTVAAAPTVNNTSLAGCEDPANPGEGTFTLEDAEDGSLPSNIGGVSVDDAGGNTVLYFDDMADANDGTITASTISSAYNAVDGTVIFARVVDATTGCFAVAEVTLMVTAAPDVIVANDPFTCPGSDVNFSETGPDSDMWMWSSDMGATFDDDASATPVVSNLVDGEEVTVIVTDINGCTASSSVVVVLEPGVDNDTCDDPIPATPSALCVAENFEGDTAGACPEAGGPTSCMQTDNPTIWFEFTADATATSVSFGNVSGNFQLYEFACPPSSSLSSCIDADEDFTVTGGQQYLISGSDAGGGMISFDLTMNAAPANDLCTAAEDASSGSANGTTACATEDTNLCSNSDHVVYYTYTTTEASATVTIEGDNGVAVDAWTDCAGTQYDDTVACGASVTISCVPSGTILTIPVGSEAGSEGDFELTITEAGSGVTNDECDGAEDITISNPCEAVSVTGDTTGACPESFTGPICTQDVDPTVWFTFTTLAGTTSAEFTNINGEFQVFTECPVMNTIGGCITGDTGLAVDPSTQYWVSATVNGGEGDVSFDIALLEAPANDDCGSAEDASSGSASGTTACASTDANLCSNGDHVVYYTYTTTQASATVMIDGDSGVSVDAWTDCGGTPYDSDVSCGSSVTVSCVPAGTVLTIPVGHADGDEGDFTITITETGSGVSNDECTDAEGITIDTPCAPVSVAGSTTGACPEAFTAGCTQDADPTVWFTFTTLGGTTSAEFTNVTGTFEIFTECPAATSISGCISGDMGIPVDPSTQYWVSASVDGGEGDVSFDIALLEAPTNDDCGSAEDASGGSAAGTTACASADGNLCSNGDHVVYYSYTTTEASATVLIEGDNGVSVDAWLDCGGTPYDGDVACGASVTVTCVPAGTTLFIPVGNADGDEGDFTLTITETGSGVSNDECTGAENIAIDVPCEPVSVAGSTTGACPEAFTAGCSQDADPTVWFTFTTLGGTTSAEFTNVNGEFQIFVDCPATASLGGCVTGDIGIDVDASTTYWISATVPGGEGDVSFDLALLEAPANDTCDNAETASSTPTVGNNGCASADAALCQPSDHVVYYTYTVAGPGSVTLSITVNAITAGDISFAALLGCGGTVIDQSCNSDGTLEIQCVPEGTEIIIPVGSGTGNSGDFDIAVEEVIGGGGGPPNDNCDAAEPHIAAECMPINIGGTTIGACPELLADCGVNMDPTVWYEVTLPAGTTEVVFENLDGGVNLGLFTSCDGGNLGCVTGEDQLPGLPESFFIAAVIPGGEGDFSFDLTALIPPDNDQCDAAADGSGGGTTCCSTADGVGCSDTNTVWHSFTPSDPNATIVITVDNVSIVGTMGVGIFTGEDCGSLIESDPCLGGASIERTVSCLDGASVFVQISSDADGCGEYSINFAEEVSSCDLGNECGSDIGIAPVTGSGQACATACNNGVCTTDCGDATIWFEITTDADATGMLIDVVADFTPTVVVLAASCDGDVQLGCQTIESTSVSVNAGETYYIGVGIADGDPGEFDLCVETLLEFALCSEGSLDITRPEFPGEDPNGPYCPGEKVEFCYSVTFFVDPANTGNNCQWLQGIVPTIGTGWDLPACPIDGQGPAGSQWFDDGDVNYQIAVSNYGIETNCNGQSVLSTSGASLGQGTPLPGGWYFVSPGTGAGCTSTANPNTAWGLAGACGSTQTVEFCFELQANNPSDIAECTDPCFSDMEVSMYIFADGQTGCWQQNSCAADDPTPFLDGSLDCGTLVFVEGPEEDEICSGEQLALDYTVADGVSDILLEVCEIDPSISGASDGFVFSGGTATISDVLVNDGTEPAVVLYCLSAVSDGGTICNGPQLEVEVTVFPEIVITFDEPYDICFDGQIEIMPTIEGGSGNYVEFEWSNGETTQNATAPLVIGDFPGPYEYTLIVTDDLGCTGEGVVEYVIQPEVTHVIEQDADFACIDGNDDEIEFCAIITGGDGNDPFTYNWSFDSDLILDIDENCFIVDEENSDPGFYEINLEVIDGFGCIYNVDPVFFSVENGPEISYTNPTCLTGGGGDVEYEFEVCDDNGGAAEWSLFDETLTVQLDGPFGGTCANFIVTPFSVGDDVPVTFVIQAVDVNTGCIAFQDIEIMPPTLPEIPEEVEGCVGETVTITMDNFNDFEAVTWCDGVSDGPSFDILLEDDETCFVTVFDLNGCELTYEIDVIVSAGAEVEISGSVEICQGTTTTLCATSDPDFDYLWSNGETTECITVGDADTYSVEVSAGDCTATDEVTVAVGANLVPLVNGDDLCTGGTVLLSTDNSFDTYQWTDPLGNVVTPTGTGPWEIEVSGGGMYTVVVSDGSCDGAGNFTVVEQTPPTADIGTATPCNSSDSGDDTVLDLSTLVTNATGNITIANPAGAPLVPPVVDFDGFAAGSLTYTVTVEGLDPCDDVVLDLIINVSDCGCPDLTFNGVPDVCNDVETMYNLPLFLGPAVDQDGTFTVTDALGNPAPTQPDATGTLTVDSSYPGGVYTVAYTLNNPTTGCPDFNTISFEVFELPQPVFEIPDPVCNSNASGDDTTIDLSTLVSGAAGNWEDEDGNVLTSTVIDYNGADVGSETFFFNTTGATGACANFSTSITINIIDCNCPIIGLNPLPGPLCQTSDEVDLAGFLVAGTEPGQWTVTGPDPDVSLDAGSVFNPEGLDGGTYSFVYTLTTPGAATCTGFVEGIIEVIEVIDLPQPADIVVCNSALTGTNPTFVDLTSIPELDGFSGEWTAPGNYNGGVIDDETNVDFLTITPGAYFFTFTTDNADAPCDNVSVDVLINVTDCDCPTIDLTSTSVCNDNGVVNLDLLAGLTPDGTFTYESGPVGNVTLNGAIFDATGAMTGEYVFLFTLVDPTVGCPETGTLTVTVFEPILVDVGPDETVCSVTSSQGNTFFDFEAVQGTQDGTWDVPTNYPDPVTDFSNVEFDGLPVGESYTFVFNGINQGDCDGTVDELTITVIDCDCPNISIDGAPELCSDGDDFLLTDLQNSGIVDGSLSAENAAGDNIGTPGDVFDATGLEDGTYLVIFTPDVAPPSDCPQQDTVFITVVAPPSAGVFTDPATLCEEDSDVVTLADLLEDEDAGGEWQETSLVTSSGAAFDEIDATFNTDGQAPGTYTFEYMFNTSNSPCDPVSETVVVEIEATPNADAGADGTIDCDNEMFTLGGSGTSVGPEFVYTWINPSGDVVYTGTDLEYVSFEGGEFTLIVENTLTGCTETSTANIVLDEGVPDFEFISEDSPCFGDEAGSIEVTNIIGGMPPFQFSLNNGDFGTTQIWENLGPGTYTVTMLDDLGCSTQKTTIIAEPGPLTFMIGDSQLIEVGESVSLGVGFSIADSSIIQTIVWTEDGEVICEGTFADGTYESCLNVEVQPPLVPTEYCLQVTTADGCEQVECRTLQALDVRDVYIPNIISGADGEADNNGTFFVNTDDFVTAINSFAIFDRWGEEVFSFEDGLPNDPAWGWDGRFNGAQAVQGVYVYLIELEYAGGETEIFTGTVTVTR